MSRNVPVLIRSWWPVHCPPVKPRALKSHVQRVGWMLASPDVGEVTFTAALRLKDVSYANELLRSLRYTSPVGTAVERHFNDFCAMGCSDSSESRIHEFFRRR